MNIPTTIFIGVISGVITSFLLYLLSKMFENNILPWYQRITYQGIDVTGRWEWKPKPESLSTSLCLTLKQNAHLLSGHALITKTNGEQLVFNAKGKIWEGYISLTMTTPDRKILSFANVLLKVSGGGKELLGDLTYRNIINDEVESITIIMSRK